jgi:hypothetical protein
MGTHIVNHGDVGFRGEISVKIRAEVVNVDPATGIVTLALEAVPMEHEVHKLLSKHFPHCYSEIDQMCAKEALIGSLQSE